MSQIWVPWPNYIGEDPTDPLNYNWLVADDALSAMMAVSQAYLRFGESANHGISSGGGCDPDINSVRPEVVVRGRGRASEESRAVVVWCESLRLQPPKR